MPPSPAVPGAPPFKPMPPEEKNAVAAFLASQADERGEQVPAGALRRDAAKVAQGKTIVTQRCTSCHLFEGKGDDSDQGLAPELAGWASLAWTRAQIANPSSKATYREHALDPARKGHMPRFDAEIRNEDIDLLAKWLRLQARRP
jgi:mono/diheme cytochrome c family protein